MDNLIETEEKLPKKLVENSLKICASDFNPKIFGPNKIQLKPLQTGNFFIKKDGVEYFISYSPNNEGEVEEINICYSDSSKEILNNGQIIMIDKDFAKYGTRHYFLCGCGRKARIFYKPAGQNYFKCRACSNLKYEINVVSKKSLGGVLYYNNRMLKLIEKREKIKRMIYGNKFTKRAQSFYDFYKKYNLKIPSDLATLAEMQILLAAKANK